VIDGVTLETGSFNYITAAIKHNAGNALVLCNVPQIAKIYATEWEGLWQESKLAAMLQYCQDQLREKFTKVGMRVSAT